MPMIVLFAPIIYFSGIAICKSFRTKLFVQSNKRTMILNVIASMTREKVVYVMRSWNKNI